MHAVVTFVITLVNYRHLLGIISSDIKLALHILFSDLHIKEFQVVNIMLHFECALTLAFFWCVCVLYIYIYECMFKMKVSLSHSKGPSHKNFRDKN